MRFVVTGSGRCGTKYMSALLTAAGIPCGHERLFNADGAVGYAEWPAEVQADSSWMAATYLPLPVPVVLLVRHPLAVVRSWVEVGFFSDVDADNPTHGPLRRFAPHVYEETTPADRALAMWLHLNQAALPHAELIVRLETFTAAQLRRLVKWAGGSAAFADDAFADTPPTNRHEEMRARTGIHHRHGWSGHRPELVDAARPFVRLLGYDPDEVPPHA